MAWPTYTVMAYHFAPAPYLPHTQGTSYCPWPHTLTSQFAAKQAFESALRHYFSTTASPLRPTRPLPRCTPSFALTASIIRVFTTSLGVVATAAKNPATAADPPFTAPTSHSAGLFPSMP